MQEAANEGSVPGAGGLELMRAVRAGAQSQRETSPRRQGERKQRPPISPAGSECQNQAKAEAKMPTCEIDYYLPLQGCAGLHLCYLNWGLGTGYLPTPPERGTCVRPRLAPSGVCYL